MAETHSNGNSTDDNLIHNRQIMSNDTRNPSSNDAEQNGIPRTVDTDLSSVNSNVSVFID